MARATIVIAVFTGAAACVGIAQWYVLSGTLYEMRIEHRAWVGPVDAVVKLPLVVNHGVVIKVAFRNMGETPAVNLFKFFKAEIIGEQLWKNGSAKIVREWQKECLISKSDHRSLSVAYPMKTPDFYVAYIRTKLNFFPPIVATKYLLTGSQILAIEGCVGYQTAGERRRSAFCYFYDEKTALDPPHLEICGTGNQAN